MGDANANVVVPGGAIPIATPQFAGGTVPVAGGMPDPSAQVQDMAKAIMQRLAIASQRKQFAGSPVPAPVPGMTDPNEARSRGMNTANPNAWGKIRFMDGVAGNIKNAVAKQKQEKLLKAEADWTYMGSALNELYAAQSSGDPKAVAAAQQKVDVVLGDPKKLKEMAKALNQDWLNPEKTTVYGEALKKVTAQQGQNAQTQANQQQAATGLKALMNKLLMRGQPTPQLTPDQKSAMSAEIAAKAPTTAGSASVQDMREGALAVLDIAKASKQLQENYQFQVGPDGRIWAINKTNPKDAFAVQDKTTGENVTGTPKGKSGIFSVKGLPVGVYHGGVPVVPGQEGWTEKDQQVLDAGMHKADLAQQLRIDPVYADQAGAPPDPADYAKGKADPEYAAALKKYGAEIQDLRMKDKTAARIAGVKAQLDYGIGQGMDADGHIYWDFKKNLVGLSPIGAGLKARSAGAQMKDIAVASDKARAAINGLKPGDFTPEQVVLLSKAMSEQDEGTAHTIMQNLAMNATNDAQKDFIVWITQLNERAMSLRNIAGMGAGAQDLRNAIRAMLPGIKSGDTKMMLKQLDAFDQQVRVLEQGIGKVGKPGTAGEAKPDSKASDPMGILQ